MSNRPLSNVASVTNATIGRVDVPAAPRLPAQEAFEGWDSYPERLPSFSSFEYDASAVRDRLAEHEKSIFSDGDIGVDITDIDCQSYCIALTIPLQRVLTNKIASQNSITNHETFFEREDVESHILASRPALRIMYAWFQSACEGVR